MQNLLLDDKFSGTSSWKMHSPPAFIREAGSLVEAMAPVGVRDCDFVDSEK